MCVHGMCFLEDALFLDSTRMDSKGVKHEPEGIKGRFIGVIPSFPDEQQVFGLV